MVFVSSPPPPLVTCKCVFWGAGAGKVEGSLPASSSQCVCRVWSVSQMLPVWLYWSCSQTLDNVPIECEVCGRDVSILSGQSGDTFSFRNWPAIICLKKKKRSNYISQFGAAHLKIEEPNPAVATWAWLILGRKSYTFLALAGLPVALLACWQNGSARVGPGQGQGQGQGVGAGCREPFLISKVVFLLSYPYKVFRPNQVLLEDSNPHIFFFSSNLNLFSSLFLAWIQSLKYPP